MISFTSFYWLEKNKTVLQNAARRNRQVFLRVSGSRL